MSAALNRTAGSLQGLPQPGEATIYSTRHSKHAGDISDQACSFGDTGGARKSSCGGRAARSQRTSTG